MSSHVVFVLLLVHGDLATRVRDPGRQTAPLALLELPTLKRSCASA